MLSILENNFKYAPAHIACAAAWVHSKLEYMPQHQHVAWVQKRLKREHLLELDSAAILSYYLKYRDLYKVTFAQLVLGIDVVLEYINHYFQTNSDQDVAVQSV
jgi:hypothetical protein